MYRCFTGGADGSDILWAKVAAKHGFEPVHFSFPGHKSRIPVHERFTLTDEQLRSSNRYCAKAAVGLGRVWPPKSAYVRKLLQRNWWQVKATSAVYAISEIDTLGRVVGGTGWAVQMYIDTHLGSPLRLYVYDQHKRAWYQYVGGEAVWTPIPRPPKPVGDFTGIGSRNIDPHVNQVVESVFS